METQMETSQNHISLFGNAFADEPDQAIPLADFLYAIKEASPSPAAVKSIEDIGTAAPPKFVKEA